MGQANHQVAFELVFKQICGFICCLYRIQKLCFCIIPVSYQPFEFNAYSEHANLNALFLKYFIRLSGFV
ncbi:hypothetical protein D3C86_1946580 [compost metagenome]